MEGEDVNVVAECSVCLQAYDDTDVVPRVLPCGHSLCQACVAALAPQTLPRCPECNHTFKLPLAGPRGLPKNIELLRLLSASKPPSSSPSPSQKKDTFESDSLAELCKWILPQSSVTLTDPQPPPSPSDCRTSSGRIAFPPWDHSVSRVYSVSFYPIARSCADEESHRKVEERGNYFRTVRSLLASLTGHQKKDLLHTLRISRLPQGAGTIFGFWMSADGHLYLVCKSLVKDWHHFRGFAKRCNTGPSTEVMTQPDHNLPKAFFIRGLELCELFSELHNEGLIAGLITPDCLGYDEFCHARLDIQAYMYSRNSFLNSLSNSKGVVSLDHYLLHNASPELLLTIGRSNTLPAPTVTYKSDSWTLGYLLCDLLFAETPLDDLLLSDLLEMAEHSLQRVESWLRGKFGYDAVECEAPCLGAENCNMHLMKNLIKCFAQRPQDRPDVLEFWHLFNHAVGDNLDHREGSLSCGYSKGQLWCLALQRDVSTTGESPVQNTVIQHRTLTGTQATVLAETAENQTEVQKSLDGHSDCVTSLAVCGEYLVSAAFDKTLCVWSLTDAALVKTLKGHSHKVMAVAADQQSNVCISGDYGGEIRVWDIETIAENSLAEWHHHQDWRYSGVASLAVSADNYLYSGGGDKMIKVWSLQDYRLVTTMEGHKSLVSALLVDKEILYSGGWDGTICLWWRIDYSPLCVLGGSLQLGAVRTLAVKEDYLLAGYQSGKIQVWRDETCINSIAAHEGDISDLCVDGDALYSGSWDGSIKVCRIEELSDTPTHILLKKFPSAVLSLACHKGHLYIGLAAKAIIVIDELQVF